MMADWTQVFVAFAIGLPATIAAVAAAVVSIRNSWKIDHNTKLTEQGTAAATHNAREARDAASDARASAEAMAEEVHVRLNGGLDARMVKTVKEHVDPLVKAFADHNAQDQRNMDKIEAAIKQLAEHSRKIPEAIAKDAAKVAVELVETQKKSDSDAFTRGLDKGMQLGYEKGRSEAMAMMAPQPPKPRGQGHPTD
jgi:flagellar biosynthesis/type III secretory pathway protein FliH